MLSALLRASERAPVLIREENVVRRSTCCGQQRQDKLKSRGNHSVTSLPVRSLCLGQQNHARHPQKPLRCLATDVGQLPPSIPGVGLMTGAVGPCITAGWQCGGGLGGNSDRRSYTLALRVYITNIAMNYTPISILVTALCTEQLTQE
ncbi:hypothetical protein CBL_02663 [Carabus blaptoides fortunei]